MTANSNFLNEKRIDYKFDMADALKIANQGHNKGYFGSISEIYQLSRGIGKLTAQEYFFYRLYDDDAYTSADKACFIGRQAAQMLDCVYLRSPWGQLAGDKLALSPLLNGLGLPVPQTVALYHPFRSHGNAVALRTVEDIAQFLRQDAEYPLFAKPVGGVNSLFIASLTGYDADTDEVILKSGGRVSVQEMMPEFEKFAQDGYCFQKCLVPHDDLIELCGDRVSSIRVFLIMGDKGPEILRATWKVTAGKNLADNFWRRGNMLCALDINTGTVERIVQDAGPQQKVLEHHPDTGAKLLGSVLPCWEQFLETVTTAAASLPNCNVQGWDVTITNDGPVLIELEGDGGHPQMVQAAQGRGLYQGRYKEFYDWCRVHSETKSRWSKPPQQVEGAPANFHKAAHGSFEEMAFKKSA